MARDKRRDDKFFDCSDYDEIYYVSNLYNDVEGVKKFLNEKCFSKDIHYSTHLEVYELIEKELGYPVPF